LLVAVLMVLTAIILPSFLGTAHAASATKTLANANHLVALVEQGLAAGNPEIAAADSTKAVIDLLERGVSGSGPFANTVFQTHRLSAAERESVLPLLHYVDGRLVMVVPPGE
jgi:hypothetical protein